jgi:hypothetical protein
LFLAIGTVINDFSGCLAGDSPMQLVLHGRKKVLRNLAV